MTTVGDLQAGVASRYAALDLPSWPDPHEGMTSPRDEEYSRLTDPGRYRIAHARARVWVAVLEEALGVRPEALESPAAPADLNAFDRGVRLVPNKSDALPLILLERDVPTEADEPTLPVLDIAVARPDVVVDRQPNCGCDACDDGSDHLLQAIDQTIAHVVGGPYVVLRGANWRAEWHPGGGGAGSDGRQAPDFRTLMDMCRRLAVGDAVRLPTDTEALVGQGWIG